MPVNVPPTATGKRRFRLAVETDPHKLVNYCCGLNYHIDEPPIKLKPDAEYPSWLWDLRLGPKPNSWEMEPGTKEYYLRLKEEEVARNNLRRMTAPPTSKTVGKVLKSQKEYLNRLRFAALAHMEEDIGFEIDSMEPDWWISQRKLAARDYYLPMSDRVIYMDKAPSPAHKNYYSDPNSTFKTQRKVSERPPVHLKAIQNSKQRHRYAGT